MGPITAVVPVPKPLRVAALDVTVHVSELTLRELAELQGVLDASRPDPYLAAREALATLEGDDRRRALVAAYEAAEAGPPVYGEGEGWAYFASMEGFALLAWVALRRNHPDLSPEDVATLAIRMSEGEREALRWHAEGGVALRVLGRMLTADVPRPAAASVGWGRAIHEVAEGLGVPYDAVYRMTLTEFRNARRGGQPDDAWVSLPDGADFEAIAADQRRRYYGEANGSH